jgi:xanthine dehydrogenase accessory factor
VLRNLSDFLVLICGGGDLATGVAHRLHRAGFTVMITELPQPLAVRRGVAFAEAVYADKITVEGVTAHLAPDPMVGMAYTVFDEIPVVVDAVATLLQRMQPPIVVDARMAKQNLGLSVRAAPLVIGLGPGFTAGVDCHAVVETNRGHNLGRVLWQGRAEPDTRRPEPVEGVAEQRVLRSPCEGVFTARLAIGDMVEKGQVVAEVDGRPIAAQFDGVVRGLLHDGLRVSAGLKVGDVDPRGVREYCFLISDKARAVGGGVLEAMLAGVRLWVPEPPVEVRDKGLP